MISLMADSLNEAHLEDSNPHCSLMFVSMVIMNSHMPAMVEENSVQTVVWDPTD